MAVALPLLERLSARVIRILGCNPGSFRLQGTNTYLVGTGSSRILIDAGDPNVPKYLAGLRSCLEEEKATISEIIVTHWHIDHVGGVPDVHQQVLAGAPLTVSKFPRASAEEHDIGSSLQFNFVADQHTFKTEGATLRALHTPGHTEDHLILHLLEENAVFSGDAILGGTSTTVEDLQAYMQSLRTMQALAPAVIYPGHGVVLQDAGKEIQHYLDHRQQRENQVVDFLSSASKPVSPLDIVHGVYVGLDPSLVRGALGNVVQHLVKLQRENRAEPVGELWKLVDKSRV